MHEQRNKKELYDYFLYETIYWCQKSILQNDAPFIGCRAYFDKKVGSIYIWFLYNNNGKIVFISIIS